MQLPEAVAEFEKESELNPLYGEVYDRLGDAYVRQGDYPKAQEASTAPYCWSRIPPCLSSAGQGTVEAARPGDGEDVPG